MILLPDIASHVQIFVGNNVHLNGFFGVGSGRANESPRPVIQDNVHIGREATFAINKEIVIQSMLFRRHRFAPDRSRVARSRHSPAPETIKPIRICRNAWIGHGVHIFKGVAVGEGAVVAAGSVIFSDVQPFSLVAGNPARVFVKNVRESALRSCPRPALCSFAAQWGRFPTVGDLPYQFVMEPSGR